ncbi:MAG: succinyl-diaminopimelate desuccinylase [Helicobacteraceae bacterium]|jgi:succinyl-diaminopimelate desuccinylase|nr:succinyl-diaminopimelate desuccinylase [Helicobacteraceae bacterium]
MNVVEVLKNLIACESVTPREAGCFMIAEKLLLPRGFTAERFDTNGVSNVLFTKPARDRNKPRLCFAGHIDVVLPGEGWSSDPFAPIEKNGEIIGRGAQDMKSGAAAFLCACAAANYAGELSILLTSDEEGDAVYGTRYVLEKLKSRGALPEFAIVAEPTCENKFGDTIKVGRRGSINGVLTLRGASGHIAYPAKFDNPIDKLARILPALSGAVLAEADAVFESSRLIFSDIRGGYEVTNLTPASVRLMFNVRNSPAIDENFVRNFVENALKNAEITDYDLAIKISSTAFLTNSPNLIAPLRAAIKAETDCDLVLGAGGGTSDARFFAEFGVAVAEFGVKNDKIHAPNESVRIADLIALEKIFANFIRRAARQN